MKTRVILASSSPQRTDILRELGIVFDAIPMDVDEVVLSTPEATVQENARLKALAAYAKFPHKIVIAADTVISHRGTILGKPRNASDAAAVLSGMSGSKVIAVTAVAVINASAQCACIATESAAAHIRELTNDDISWYIGTGEPLTRAGSLGISRYGEIFVEKIEGAYSCFSGLPKRALLAAIARIGLAGEILPNGLPVDPIIVAQGLSFTEIKLG